MTITTKQAVPFYRNHQIRDGIGQAIYDAMKVDASIVLVGEGAHVKQHYDAPKILKEFHDRIVTLPISEDGNTNYAVGMSLLGVKPVVDVITADFLYRTMDSVCNTAAKLNFVLGADRDPSTIVIRSEFMVGGPSTGQRPEALFAHVPGLRVVVPSTPRDAYGLMRTALTTPGVTLFFEDRMIADEEHPMLEEDSHLGDPIPLGVASWRRKGLRGNVTILTYGVMRQVTEKLLAGFRFNGDFSGDHLLGAGLIDLRTIYPVDWSMILMLLERTGKLLIIEPDVKYGGVGAEIAATIAEKLPGTLIRRLGAPRSTIPASMSLHHRMLPSETEILDALTEMGQ